MRRSQPMIPCPILGGIVPTMNQAGGRMEAKAKPTDAEIEAACKWAWNHAALEAPKTDQLAEDAHDAATDAILWALDHWQPGRDFGRFARTVVRLLVRRKIRRASAQFHRRPSMGELSPDLESAEQTTGGDDHLPDTLTDLPADLRDAVRLYYLDAFTLRECGLLLGCSMETVRQRLTRAAQLLDPHATPPARRNGEKRIAR